MESLLDTLTQLFIDWGYLGLFLSAFVAGSVLPFSSEIVMVVLLGMGLDGWGCLLAASMGNTLGGMTCYWVGTLGKSEWIEKYLHVEHDKLQRVVTFLSGKGAVMAFFAFLPYVGEAVAVGLGLLRSNVWLTTLAMFIGKALRYGVVLLIGQEILRFL